MHSTICLEWTGDHFGIGLTQGWKKPRFFKAFFKVFMFLSFLKVFKGFLGFLGFNVRGPDTTGYTQID